MTPNLTPHPDHKAAAASYSRAAKAKRHAIQHPHTAEREAANLRFWLESANHHRKMAMLTKPVESWLDLTGDDVFHIHNTGTLLPSKPIGFGGPRFLYLREGDVLEVEPTVHAESGLSCWKITVRKEVLEHV